MAREYFNPPQWPQRLLTWCCPPSLLESIEGDLYQQFEEDCEQVGIKRAKRRFIINTLRFIRPGIILRNKFTIQLFNSMMLGNYLKVATRNMAKRKLYSFINAFGLSIGLCFCMLIYLFIQDEQSFDQFHENKSHIYRIEEKSYDKWQHDTADPYRKSAWIQTALQPALKAELPEVKYATRYSNSGRGIVRYEDKVLTERLTYVDADFFKMFSFPLLKGNVDKIFQNKSDVVLTTAIAEKYFGDEDPIGKTIIIEIEKENSFTVVGIISRPPANSSIDFEILLPQENRPWYEHNLKQWGNFNTPTFVQLASNANLISFEENLSAIIQKNMGPMLEQWRKDATVPIPADVKMFEYQFTPLTDWHLKTEINWEKVSDPIYSMILGGMALLILLIACINYISLSLTTSASRKMEVGIRKVVGADRNQLVYQFGFESLLLAFASLFIAFILLVLFLPAFNDFTTKKIDLNASNLPYLIGVSLLLTLFVGLLAGSYPSFFLSRFKPIAVLKGGFTSKLKASFTQPLVVMQFALSAFLIISSVVMHRQMNYITTKELGYDKNQVLVIPTQSGWTAESDKVIEQFRQRASQETKVISVSGTSVSFSQGFSRYGYKIKGEQKAAYVYAADSEYIPTLGIELVQGRNFDPNIASDSTAVIVNEALVKDMKWENPLSEHLNWTEDSVGLGYQVIGVVKDYHFLSLEESFEPMFLSINRNTVGHLTTMLVKISSTEVPAGLETVKSIWKELYPNKPFDYTFLDEDVARQYESYERWMSIMTFATIFAIIISCLGLFGLAGINAVNRTKEIGIRKVMGAELGSIFLLLNKQYIWLSLIAYSLAIPFSWYSMNKWLADFSYKIEMGWELFLVAILIGLLIAVGTVSYHAIKAAMVNPAETLKYE